MPYHRTRRILTIAAALLSVGAAFAGCSDGVQPDEQETINRSLDQLRQVTAKYQNISTALANGYLETPLTNCWQHVSAGGMGYHYQNPDFVNDGKVTLLEPELLMYEPQADGRLVLVGMEYIVSKDQWQGSSNPVLLGQTLQEHPDLPIYKLHIWLWRDNQSGIFADWNPAVTCDHAADKTIFE